MEATEKFYWTKTWHKCRDGFVKYKRGLCEACLSCGIYKPGEIVHHKIFLNADNINIPEVSLNWDNLELLCRDCHAKRHGSGKRYKVDEFGRAEIR